MMDKNDAWIPGQLAVYPQGNECAERMLFCNADNERP